MISIGQEYMSLRVDNRKITFLFFNQNICCEYSKEPSQWDGSLEHPKHMLKIMGKKILTILRWNFLLRVRNRKITFLFYNQKHMLWELKRTVSMRRFCWAPKTFKKLWVRKYLQFYAEIFVYLNPCCLFLRILVFLNLFSGNILTEMILYKDLWFTLRSRNDGTSTTPSFWLTLQSVKLKLKLHKNSKISF